MERAPFYSDLAEGPEGGAAFWATADDGVSVRIGMWPGPDRGTVFLLPGRSEYIEKYGRTASDLAARGYATISIDWRGQGLADRLLGDPHLGHVEAFSDYQHDLQTMIAAAREHGLPEPWMILAHSMGGCIALRALTKGHTFSAAAFSAPMWGISIAPSLRRFAKTVPRVVSRMGFGNRYAPTTSGASYLLTADFDANTLTTDRGMWDYMVRQAAAQPRFRLGGPSVTWLARALEETRALAALPRPALPVHISVGTLEKIVEIDAITAMAADWPSASLEIIQGAEHELLMERDDVRLGFLDRAFGVFEAA